MTIEEYLDRCYHISYERGAKIEKFGEPMNCYGFVYWFYKLCLGKELPRNDIDSFSDIEGKLSYVATDNPVDGDVVNMRSTTGVYATHVGFLYKDNVYHFSTQGTMCKNRYRMANWIKGYYHVI